MLPRYSAIAGGFGVALNLGELGHGLGPISGGCTLAGEFVAHFLQGFFGTFSGFLHHGCHRLHGWDVTQHAGVSSGATACTGLAGGEAGVEYAFLELVEFFAGALAVFCDGIADGGKAFEVQPPQCGELRGDSPNLAAHRFQHKLHIGIEDDDGFNRNPHTSGHIRAKALALFC